MRSKVILPLTLGLAACTVGPDYKGPPAAISEAALAPAFVGTADPSFSQAPALARWWESLSDPLLSQLIDDALRRSPTIDEAEGHIREARASVRSERANSLPSVSASGAYVRAQLPGSSIGGETSDSSDQSSSGSSTLEIYNLGGTASWEPDLFGSGRRGREQAEATLGQRYAEFADVQVSLSAQVAQAYVALIGLREQIRLNTASSERLRQSLALNARRRDAGQISTLDVVRLRTELENTDANRIPLAAQVDERLNELAVLTGRLPHALDTLLDGARTLPTLPAQVPIGDPASLIARRPDIRAAERALAASTARIGVDRAKQFPSLSFMGIIGLGGSNPGDVVDPDKLTTLLAPMLSWSFLDFGRNKAAVDQSTAKRDVATAHYRGTVLGALRDAENSLSRFGNTRLQLAQLVRAQASANQAMQLNALRVSAGEASTIDQLDAQRQFIAAELAVVEAQISLINCYIVIHKSLGLGWDELPGRSRTGSTSQAALAR